MVVHTCTLTSISLSPLSLLRLVVSTPRDSLFLSANFPEDVVAGLPQSLSCRVYYGWARVDEGPTQQMVMSIGWNPQYMNDKKSMVCSPVL